MIYKKINTSQSIQTKNNINQCIISQSTINYDNILYNSYIMEC